MKKAYIIYEELGEVYEGCPVELVEIFDNGEEAYKFYQYCIEKYANSPHWHPTRDKEERYEVAKTKYTLDEVDLLSKFEDAI